MSTIARGEVTIAVLLDGEAGTDGRSITNVTPYYLVHPNSTGVTMTTHPLANWSTTLLNTTVTNKYLWRIEVFTWNLAPLTSQSSPYVIGQHSEDGATAWTTTVAPVSPGYTFTKTNLKGPTGFIPKVGDIIFYRYYRYTISTIASTTVLGIDRVTIRGATGAAGTAGVSITGVVNWYLATSASTGVTTATTGWTTTIQAPIAAKKYLWNYEVVSYSNSTTTTTTPVLIGNYAADGSPGAAGISISDVEHYYLATTAATGVTTSTSGWTTSIQTMTSTNKYLWKYEKVVYSSGTKTPTTPAIIGHFAIDGSTGAAGVSITKIENYYLISDVDTGIVNTNVGFSLTLVAPTDDEPYLWSYGKVTFSDATTSKTTAGIIGNYAYSGPEGNGILSIQEFYAVNGSKTVPPTVWFYAPPETTNDDKYLWNYETIVYTINDPVDSVPRIIGVYGQTAYEAALEGGYEGTLDDFYNDISYIQGLEATIEDITDQVGIINAFIELGADGSITAPEKAELRMTADRVQWESNELYLKLGEQGTIATNLNLTRDALLDELNRIINTVGDVEIDEEAFNALFLDYQNALIAARSAVKDLLEGTGGIIETISLTQSSIKITEMMGAYLEQVVLESDSLTFNVMNDNNELIPVIALGKNEDDEYELAFYNETTKVSYFKGAQMYIPNAIITNTLQVGNHTIEKHSNDKFTVFRWIG